MPIHLATHSRALLTKEQTALSICAADLLSSLTNQIPQPNLTYKKLFSLERKCNRIVNRATQVELSFSPVTDIRSALTTVGCGAKSFHTGEHPKTPSQRSKKGHAKCLYK